MLMKEIKKGRLDIGKCFNDAFPVYRKNLPVLLLASFIFIIVSFLSFFILSGVMSGGLSFMTLRAMRKEDKKVDLSEMFRTFNKFLPITGLFIIELVLVLSGFVLFIVPGFLLGTMWLYSIYLMVDKDTTILDSLKISWNAVRVKGVLTNLLLLVICVILGGSGSVPLIGWLLNLFLLPLSYLIVAAGYIQQFDEDDRELSGTPEK